MRIILKQGESVQAQIGGAPTTTNPVALADYTCDATQVTDSVLLNGSNPVTLAAPLKSDSDITVCNRLSVYNADTVNQLVTVSRVNAAGTAFPICGITLAAGSTLQVDDFGIRVTNTAGQVLNSI